MRQIARAAIVISRITSAVTVAAGFAVAGAVVAVPAASAASHVFPTMNDAGGIYWRSGTNWNTPVSKSGYGVYPGTKISVSCYQHGTANVPGTTDAMWVKASWASGPGTGSGWINEHFVNDGAPINKAAPGVPACTPPTTGSGGGGGSSSGTGGYPWAKAVCEFGSAGGAHCTNPKNSKDMYDWGYRSGSTFRPYDQWGYEYRNCTSYVAWRLASAGVNASLFKDLGNADTWIRNVSGKAGVTVNKTPSPGAIAVWNTPGVGHVAWVDSVSGGKVTVSDYNYLENGTYDQHTISSAPSDYIHFP